MIVLFFLGVSFTYSLKVKSLGILANLTVGFAGSLGFPFGALFFLDWPELIQQKDIWLLYLVAFFLLVSREIVKDIEDIEGDTKFKINSLALKLGIKSTIIIILIIFTALLTLFTISMFRYNFNVFFIIFAMMAIIVISLGIWALNKDIELKKWRILASRLFLIAQLLSILAFLFALVKFE